MKIIIDDREKDKERIQMIKNGFITPVIMKRLDVGDLVIEQQGYPTICIENKTWQDFISSYRNGQLYKEVTAMKQKYDYSFVIVYDNGKWNKEYVNQNANEKFGNIASVILQHRCYLIQCDNSNEYIPCVKALIRNIKKADKPLSAPDVLPNDSNDMIRVLCGIPGVGRKMARKLLDEFGTPGQVFKADDDALNSIPRIQKKSKEAIRRMR